MSTDWLGRLSQIAQHAVGTLRVRSALNPFLWACPVVGGVCFTAALAFKSDHQIALLLVIAGVSPIGLLIVVGMFLTFFRTDKLQSEEYQIRQRTLELIQEKGGRFHVDPASLQSIVTPDTDRGQRRPPEGPPTTGDA